MKPFRSPLVVLLIVAFLAQAGWSQERHSDSKHGFSIQVPQGWTIKQGALGLLFMSKHYSWIRVDSVSQEAEGRAKFAKRKAALEAKNSALAVKLLTVDGRPTPALLSRQRDRVDNVEMLVVGQGRAFVLEASCPQFIHKHLIEEFYSVLESFQIAPAPVQEYDF